MLKRLRGMFGTAIVWAGAWAFVGAVVTPFRLWGVLQHVLDPRYTRPATRLILRLMGQTALSCAITGALSGWIFAAALTALERRRTLHTISAIRVGIWGAIGSGLLPLALIPLTRVHAFRVFEIVYLRGLGFSVGVSAVLGGVSAAGSILLARRASGAGLGSGAAPSDSGAFMETAAASATSAR